MAGDPQLLLLERGQRQCLKLPRGYDNNSPMRACPVGIPALK
jgi:hypothetical protein